MTAADERAAFAARLEQLATVTQVTLSTVLRVVEARQGGPLNPQQQEVIGVVRQDVERAVAAIDEWDARDEPVPEAQDVDLAGLRRRLGSILETIDRAVARGSREMPALGGGEGGQPPGGDGSSGGDDPSSAS